MAKKLNRILVSSIAMSQTLAPLHLLMWRHLKLFMPKMAGQIDILPFLTSRNGDITKDLQHLGKEAKSTRLYFQCS